MMMVMVVGISPMTLGRMSGPASMGFSYSGVIILPNPELESLLQGGTLNMRK
jgi:hypothetical protein